MIRAVWRDGKWRDKTTGTPIDMPTDDRICAPMIQSDLPAYMSPLGTGLIDGRKARREDLKRANCREVDPDSWKPSEAFQEARKRS